MSKLETLLVEHGLLQFGMFVEGAKIAPLRVSLHLLPSYPEVLSALAAALADRLTTLPPMERLVCTAQALPLGVVLSQQTGIPLVYSQGTAERELVGAYDVGHPALLLTYSLDDSTADIKALITRARRTGLELEQVLVVLGHGVESGVAEAAVSTLLFLPDVLRTLYTDGYLPAGQLQAVLDWLAA